MIDWYIKSADDEANCPSCKGNLTLLRKDISLWECDCGYSDNGMECVKKMKFEFYDFFISIAYGYLGQFVEEGDEDALAYEVQFEPHEDDDRFVFKQFITKPSHFNESDLTEEIKRHLEDLVGEHYKPSHDVLI
jgi:hypothetical protein